MIQIRPAPAEGQLIIAVEGDAVAHIVGRVCQFVDDRNNRFLTVTNGSLDSARIAGVVQSMGPGIGTEEAQSVGVAFFHFGL